MANVYEALQRGRKKTVPIVPPRSHVTAPLPMAFGPEMRTLAGRLQPLLDDRKPVILAITASMSGEGASTVARGLAQYLAGEGHAVLFCGNPADLGMARGEGTLVGAAQVRELRQTGQRGLVSVDISDLQRSDSGSAGKIAFRDWLKANRDPYDVIIIDVPPLLQHQSWSAFMGYPDGIIMVVEAERARSSVMKATTHIIEEASGHVLGLVFNKRRQYIPRSFYKWV